MGYYMNMVECDFFVDAKNAKAVEKVLCEYDFEPCFNENGDIIEIEFTGEKLWSHDQMCEEIAPHVKEGSYIELRGENDAIWRWVFKNSKYYEIYPTITWPDVP